MSLLVAPDPAWATMAQGYINAWHDLNLPGLVRIHHIGSTSVPGLPAKPIIDLLPVFADDTTCDGAQAPLDSLGYEWLGAFGLAGRRYCRLDDANGTRCVQAHAYVQGHPDILRHVAFRDALRENPMLRAAYTREKARCAALHGADAHAYGDCKSDWIKKAEAKAVQQYTGHLS